MSDPIQPEYRTKMNQLAHAIDEWFNGPLQPGAPREIGFILLTARFGEIKNGRVNYISNGQRADMIAMLREYLARLEGRVMDEPGRQQ